jgi:hypothetical protein
VQGRFLLYDEMFPVGQSGRPEPNFSVQEVAKTFFGRKADWLRWRYKSDQNPRKPELPAKHPHGFFVLDGKPLEPKTTEAGARYYTLADIERMGHALCQNDAIDADTLTYVVDVAVAVALLHGIDVYGTGEGE